MAVAFVAATQASAVTDTTNSTTFALTTNRAVAAGNTILIGVAQRLGGAATSLGAADASGTGAVWTLETLNSVAGMTMSTGIIRGYCPAGLPSAAVVTFTFDVTTSRKFAHGIEVSGLANRPADVIVGTNGSTGASPATGTSANSTVDPNSYAFASFAHAATLNTAQGTPGAGYTERGDLGVGASSWLQGYTEDQVLSALGTQSASFTAATDTTTNWIASLCVFGGLSSRAKYRRTLQAANRAASF